MARFYSDLYYAKALVILAIREVFKEKDIQKRLIKKIINYKND